MAQNTYSSDEEGSDFEAGRPKKHPKGQALKDSDESDSEEEEEEEASESASGEENGNNDGNASEEE